MSRSSTPATGSTWSQNAFNVSQSTINQTTESWCQHFKASDFVHLNSNYTSATRTAVAFAFILIMVINVLGNLMVIIAVIVDRPLRQITSGLIVSLAAADILVALSAEVHSIVLILSDQDLHVSQIMCGVSTSADLYFSLCELLHLACLAIERCMAICHPFQYERISRVFLLSIIVLAWTLPLAFSFVPIILFQQMIGQRHVYECLKRLNIGICVFLPDKFFSTLLFSVMFVLPTSIIFYCYARICLVAHSQNKRLNSISLGTFSSNVTLSRDTTSTNSKELIPMTFTYNAHRILVPDIEQGNDEEDEIIDTCVKPVGSNRTISRNPSSLFEETSDPDNVQRPKDLNKKWPNKVGGKSSTFPKCNGSEDFKAARSIGFLCVFFLVTWAPYWLAVLLLPFVGYPNFANVFIGSALWLNFLGTALNPFIYYFSNGAVREGILRVFRKLLKHLPKLTLTITQRRKGSISEECIT